MTSTLDLRNCEKDPGIPGQPGSLTYFKHLVMPGLPGLPS